MFAKQNKKYIYVKSQGFIMVLLALKMRKVQTWNQQYLNIYFGVTIQ